MGDKWSGKAQMQKAMMEAAKKEEKEALELEVSGNHQINMAALHASNLQDQEKNIQSLYTQEKERKSEAQRYSDEANRAISSAQKTLHEAEKKYESRLAAQNFLSDVRLVTAEEEAARARARKENANTLVHSSEAALAVATQKISRAQAKATGSSDKMAEAEESDKLAKKALQEVTAQKDEAAQKVSATAAKSMADRRQENQEVKQLNSQISREKLERKKNLTKK